MFAYTKGRIVTLRVAELAVPGCKGLSTMVRRPTYAILSRNQFCRELRAHGRGGSQKVTGVMTRGRGGVKIPPTNDDVIYEQPLIPKDRGRQRNQRLIVRDPSKNFCQVQNAQV